MEIWTRFVNETSIPMRIKVVYGDFNQILFDVPIGGEFQVRVDKNIPTVIINNVPIKVSEGDNVININDQKPSDS